MRILILDLAEEGTPARDLAKALEAEILRQGRQATFATADGKSSEAFACRSGMDLVLGASPEHRHVNESVMETLAPDILIAFSGAPKQSIKLPELGLSEKKLLCGFNVRVEPGANAMMENLFSSQRWSIALPAQRAARHILDRALDIAAKRIGLEQVSSASGGTATAAMGETARQLSRLHRLAPDSFAVPRLVENRACAGALESVQDEEVILESTLWIKGWITWDEKRFRRLEAVLDDRVIELTPTDVRADIVARDGEKNPVGFEAEIDLVDLPGRLRLEIWIVDRAGLRWRWLTRHLWLNNSMPSRLHTPLLTGWARIDGNKVTCRPGCAGNRVTTVVAYQAGQRIGAFSAAAGRAVDGEMTFWIAKSGLSSRPIHLHVFHEEEGWLPWLCLDARTGRLAEDASHGSDDGQVVSGSTYRAAWGPDQDCGAISWTVNGVAAAASGPCAEIDISRESGRVVIEAETAQRDIRVWNVWRHCRDAADGPRLPCFVVPPGGRPATARRETRPRVLLLRAAAAPTDELYVVAPLQRMVETGQLDLVIVDTNSCGRDEAERLQLLAQVGSVIVSRYLPDPWIASLSRQRHALADVYYVLDDNLTLAEEDPRMEPRSYRRRMIGVAHSEFQTMLHLCTRLIVTSKVLRDLYASDKTDLLTPPYVLPCGDLGHLSDLSEIRIEYHGTSVHRDDVEFLIPALLAIRDSYGHVKLNLWTGHSAPPRLHRQERVTIHKEMPWPAYKRHVSEARAHIALAPLLNKPYNLGKSFVKVHDIARLGAVGLYSRRDPYIDVVTHDRDGYLMENDPKLWERTLRWLIENPEEIVRTAHAAQDLATDLGNIGRLERYWAKQLLADAAAVEHAGE